MRVDGIEVPRRFRLGDGGVDEREALLWWPSRPVLLDAELTGWAEVLRTHRGHPSVVVWVTINESWGVPEVETDATRPVTPAPSAMSRSSPR